MAGQPVCVCKLGLGLTSPYSHTGMTMTNRVLNDRLLAYIESYSQKFPNRWTKLYSALDAKRHGSGAALPPSIVEIAPVFFARALDLVGNNPALCKRTILYRLSNACPVCGNPMERPTGGACSRKCRGLNPVVLEKARTTSRLKYGTDSPMQNEAVKDNLRRVFIERYGVDNPQKNSAIKAKTVATTVRRYGVTSARKNASINQRAKDTMVERFGVENPGQSKELVAKREATNLAKSGKRYHSMSTKTKAEVVARNVAKYGVGNAMQHPEVIERCRRATTKRKVFVEKNGRVHDTVQGYEPQVLHWLNTVKGVENFITRPGRMTAINTGKGVYVPDARFKSKSGKKYLLEVKSDHTLLSEWTKNLNKFRVTNDWCEEHGYTFLLAISKGEFDSKPVFVKAPNGRNVKLGLVTFWTESLQ